MCNVITLYIAHGKDKIDSQVGSHRLLIRLPVPYPKFEIFKSSHLFSATDTRIITQII